jgi:hypothetical protein
VMTEGNFFRISAYPMNGISLTAKKGATCITRNTNAHLPVG